MAGAAIPQASNDFYFNPIDPSFRDNPYPHYPALLCRCRRASSMFSFRPRWSRAMPIASRCCATPSISRVGRPRCSQQLRAEFGPFAGATTMLDSDPPVHTRLRRLVNRAFTSRRVKDMEPRIRAIADDLLDRIAHKGDFDLMDDFAGPLPVIVIAEMLGVPPEEHTQFKTWSNQIIEGGRGSFRGVAPGEQAKTTSQELRAYLADADRAASARTRRGSHHRAGAGS